MRIAMIWMSLWLLGNVSLFAQVTAAETDSVSYSLYLKGDWRHLAEYGESAAQTGYDFYYLNLRTGIAFFSLKKWRPAEKYLLRSIANYPEEMIAKEYLYWVFLETGRPIEAAETLSRLPREAQKRLDNPPRKWVSSLLVEGGFRNTSKPDTAKTFKYYGIGLEHKFSPALRLYHAYSDLQQDFFWGGFRQRQYYVAPSYFLKNGWAVKGGLNLMKYESNFDYLGGTAAYADTVLATIGSVERILAYNSTYDYTYSGKYLLEAYYGHLALEKTQGRLHLSLQFSQYGERSESTFDETVDSVAITNYFLDGELDSTTLVRGSEVHGLGDKGTFSQQQLGASAAFTLPYGKGKYALLGAEVQVVFGEETHLLLVPFFRWQFHRKMNIGGNYLRKGNYPLAIFNGGLVLNNYDQYFHRLTLTGNFRATPRINLFCSYQWESIEDDFLAGKYTGTGFFGSLSYHF